MSKPFTLKLTLLAAFIIALVVGVMFYFRYLKLHPSTDNATLSAPNFTISSQLSGQVDEVLVKNHQSVKKGDLLLTVVKKPFALQLDSANDLVAQRQAEANLAEIIYKAKRFSGKGVSDIDKKTAEDQFKSAAAALKAAKAQAKIAADHLNHCEVRAPADGTVNRVSLKPGDALIAQQPLFSLVGNKHYWIEANFKETQLENIKPGEPVTIKLDAYPSDLYTGTVTSISTGTGSAFALLPAENASGNWVKVTQRVPVWITIKNPKQFHRTLVLGQSATVMIDTTHEK